MKSFEIFLAEASKTNCRFSLEAFSFTHQRGLNIYFEDYEEFKSICADVELEFWNLSDHVADADIAVSHFASLEKIVGILYDLNPDNYDKVADYDALVSGGYVNWSDVEKFHENNLVTEYTNNCDFGHYLCQDVGLLTIPEEIQGYFDYEAYGRDCLQNSYLVCNKKVFNNN